MNVVIIPGNKSMDKLVWVVNSMQKRFTAGISLLPGLDPQQILQISISSLEDMIPRRPELQSFDSSTWPPVQVLFIPAATMISDAAIATRNPASNVEQPTLDDIPPARDPRGSHSYDQ